MEARTDSGCLPLILILLLVLGISVPVVMGQDDVENDTLALILLQDGDVIEGEFEGSVNGRLYAFVGQAGDSITISMVQPDDSLLDPYLVLLGVDGQVFAVDDDSGPVLLSAEINNYELPEDGVYLVLVTTYPGLRFAAHDVREGGFLEPEPYTLSFNGSTTLLEDEDELELLPLDGEIGMTETIIITEDFPVALITFQAEAGEVITIRTTETGEEASSFDHVDTLLYLFDREGYRLMVDDDADLLAGDLFAAIESFEIPEDGVYLVMATAYNYYDAPLGEWMSEGSFLITIMAEES